MSFQNYEGYPPQGEDGNVQAVPGAPPQGQIPIDGNGGQFPPPGPMSPGAPGSDSKTTLWCVLVCQSE